MICALSCTTATRPAALVEKAKLMDVSRAFLKVHHPNWVKETYDFPCNITDLGDFWEVCFVSPSPEAPGAPVIYVAKDNLTILAAFHEQ
jgi:hypothetical protein